MENLKKENCPLGIENRERIISVSERLNRFETSYNERMNKFEKSVSDIRNDLIKRPSWTVVFLLTTLSSSTLALAVLLFKHILNP